MKVENVSSRSMTVDMSTIDTIGQVAYETMALCAVVKQMKKRENVDPFLLTSWKNCDNETRLVYKTIVDQILKAICSQAGLKYIEVDPSPTPPWAGLFQLLKTQPNTSEANVIFNALSSGPLPEA